MSPLEELHYIIDSQKSIRTGRLGGLIGRLVREIKRKDKRIKSQDLTIEKLNKKYGRVINKYNKIKGSVISMNIGQAIEAVKEGKRATRKGWNGSGMYIYYVPGGEYPTQTESAKKEFGETAHYNPYLAIKTAQGSVSTWAPSGSDALATDWEIVG